MNRDRNLLFAALALQTGMIDAGQFAEACQVCGERPDESLEDVLVERGWIWAVDRPHLEYLRERLLHEHNGDARAALRHLPRMAGQALAALEGIDSESTVAGSPPAADNRQDYVAKAAPSIGTRYAFTRLHATGGIGRVWRARDRQLDREVALKELHPERAGDSRAAARFVREARLTGQLEHPGIVPVYELTSQADSREPFYTMRFVRGRTLTSAIAAYHAKRQAGQAEPLELVALLTAFAAVCNTVAYAHSRRVLHRDLKGENVMLGDFGEVILLDWGLAKLMDQAEEEATDTSRVPWSEIQDAGLTVQGEIIGTPAYMAPEQAEGRLGQIDERTDVYGLGAMLYEILTGQPPFVGANTREVLYKVIRGHPAPPRELWPEVPPALEEACLKALAKDPAQRYARADELAQEVQRWQEVQRRRAEDALRRQTEILRSILNSMSEGVLVSDEAGELLLINPAAERMLNRPEDATLAGPRSANEFYHPDRVTRFESHDLPSARAIRGEEVNDMEMFIRPVAVREGIWASANARPLRDQAGALRGGVVVFRDISDRKRTEEELLRSRERFELAVRGSQDGLWDWDLRTGDVYYSPRWKSILGYEDHEIAHRIEEWEERLHPDERAQVLAANLAYTEGARPHYEYEYRLRHKNGSYRWILSRGVALRDAAGKAYRMAGSHVDITERKQAEEERGRLLVREQEARGQAEVALRVVEEAREALRASEEQYRSLANLLPGAVWTARADGAIDYANQFWLDFTGMTLEQTLGSGWLAALHPEDVEKVSRVWSKALATGELVEIDYRLRRSDGVYRGFLARGKAVRDREGQVVKWFGLLTELEHAEQSARNAMAVGS
jgi:eukaryotic-like serine/threonine-protein kinase